MEGADNSAKAVCKGQKIVIQDRPAGLLRGFNLWNGNGDENGKSGKSVQSEKIIQVLQEKRYDADFLRGYGTAP